MHFFKRSSGYLVRYGSCPLRLNGKMELKVSLVTKVML